MAQRGKPMLEIPASHTRGPVHSLAAPLPFQLSANTPGRAARMILVLEPSTFPQEMWMEPPGPAV